MSFEQWSLVHGTVDEHLLDGIPHVPMQRDGY